MKCNVNFPKKLSLHYIQRVLLESGTVKNPMPIYPPIVHLNSFEEKKNSGENHFNPISIYEFLSSGLIKPFITKKAAGRELHKYLICI